MRLRKVRLQNIFSFVDASLTCDRHVTALVGPNDAGKTNILRTLDHLIGRKPNLKFGRHMRCQFENSGEPAVELTFIGETSDQEAVARMLDVPQPPTAPFHLVARCEEDLLTIEVGGHRLPRPGQKGEEVLGQLAHSLFVQPSGPLRALIPIAELKASPASAEARLLYQAGLKPGKLAVVARGARQGYVALAEASANLTKQLQSYGIVNPSLHVHLSYVDDGTKEGAIQIGAGDTEETNVSLAGCGEGLRWFLGLVAQLVDEAPRKDSLCALLLLDEPGVFLHPGAQGGFRSELMGAPDRSAVLYTTHSPFMLDWSRPHEIRVVERLKGAIPASVIVDKPHHSDGRLKFWEPFRRSIGLVIGHMGLLGDRNLLVEGVSDQIILSHLARISGDRRFADWRIIPADNDDALVLIARVCRQANLKTVVLVDGDKGGGAHRKALEGRDCNDVEIHNLLEFCRNPRDDVAFCIEDLLAEAQYIDAVNESYRQFPWYDSINETEIKALDMRESIATRIKNCFEGRNEKGTWRDGKRHEFNKVVVSHEIASTYRPLELKLLPGDFLAISNRLEHEFGPIFLGEVPGSIAGSRQRSLAFSLAVKGRVGVKRITVLAKGVGQKGVLVFPSSREESIDSGAGCAPGDSSVHEPVPEGSKTAPDAQAATAPKPMDGPSGGKLPTDNSIQVFDCWMRRWIVRPKLSFLEIGAAVIHVPKSIVPKLPFRITFAVEYADSERQEFPPIDLTEGGKQISGAARFMIEREEGDLVKGIVSSVSRHGFGVKIDGYDDTEGFVYIRQITGEYVADISDFAEVGKPVCAKYMGYDREKIQLSLIGVTQPTADA